LEQASKSRNRHERDCKVCHHLHREQIERDWVAWGDTTRIAKQYQLSRDSIYRHAHALGLFAKRRRNIRQALERIIEKAETVPVSASSVVAAVQAYAKINTSGQWIERQERVDMNALFERMTREELDAYARDGKLPDWFVEAVGATNVDTSNEDESE
jgi:hypothetical protein